MNCLEYRRRLTADPAREDDAQRTHRDQCVACRTFARGTRARDADLARAMTIEAPASLAARVLFRHQVAQSLDADLEAAIARALAVAPPQQLAERVLERARSASAPPRRAWRAVQLAAAASIALAVAVGSVFSLRPGDPTLAVAVIEHVQAESWALDNDRELPRPLLQPVLRMVGLDLDGLSNVITHATPCDILSKRSLHMVMAGVRDKVSVFVMPDQPVDGMLSVQRDRFATVVMPVRHGSLAVVGHPDEDLRTQAQAVRTALRWRM